MEHIFFAEKKKNAFFLPKEELKHIGVLRINLPAVILFSCGDGKLYRGIAGEGGEVSEPAEMHDSLKTGIDVYFGVCDKSRISFILEKCTELGADSFTPLLTARSEKYALPKSRASRVIISALKQSRRFFMPEYRDPMRIEDLEKNDSVTMIFGSIKKSSEEITLKNKNTALIIGPPLGFTEEEEDLLLSKGALPFHFDTGILRTETFAVSLLSIVHYIKGANNG
ncbi:MAG: RsmE family RNA methyltransferase [bacterium]|nr:RsmE family RNA methyltransferase [bacterium]